MTMKRTATQRLADGLVVLSCLLLGEPFSWRYLLSGALVTVGICAVNLPGKGKN